MSEEPGSVTVRPLDERSDAEIELVALRMRATLVEVLGAERGGAMYTIDWLRDRVRWHLDPTMCQGRVLVALLADEPGAPASVVGHCIVRAERQPGPTGELRAFGLFSTTYVLPAARRLGTASALVVAGESWLRGLGLRAFATDTDDHNRPLIRLFERHGYSVVYTDAARSMVRLWKDER